MITNNVTVGRASGRFRGLRETGSAQADHGSAAMIGVEVER